MLTVFNVGQGDSFLFKANDKGCTCHVSPLLIDCGPSNSKIHSKIIVPEFSLMITHSHKDHIGGLNKSIISKATNIFIPYYLPEVIKISEYLNKYIKSSIKSIDYNYFSIKNINLVKHGDMICNHLKILNPPSNPTDAFMIGDNVNISIENALGILRENGFEFPNEEIINYQSELLKIDPDQFAEYGSVSRRFVHLFFISLAIQINHNFKHSHYDILYQYFEITCNQASIVFRYENEMEKSLLMTGDADTQVFERLISVGENIQAFTLKIPHHGSRSNISKSIIDIIEPTIAIISHNNGIFGRSNDPHPHYDIIDMLEKSISQVLYTNDVRKNNRTIRLRTEGTLKENDIEFL